MRYNISKNQIEKVEIMIAGQKILLNKIINPEILVEQVSNNLFNLDERLPYWAELWPSANALAEFILNNIQLFKNKKVIELGSGLGMAGIAARYAGAQVLFTDYETQSLEFCRKNYFINFKEYPETKLLDWRDMDFEQKFEIILAADVLYEKRFIDPFVKTISYICKKNGTVFLSEPNRPVARPFFEIIRGKFSVSLKKDFLIQNTKVQNKISIYGLTKC